MKKIRQLHLYLGLLFAPAIIFFSLTGALQTFSLHESASAGAAAPLIAAMAQVHKNQTLMTHGPAPEAGPKPNPSAKSHPTKSAESANRGPSPLPLKIFVLFMALGLITTTLLGIYMAFKYNRDRRVIWGLLILGILMPLSLLYL